MTTTELPKLELDKLTKLVDWAQATELMPEEDLLEKFPGWGVWNQSSWSEIYLSDDDQIMKLQRDGWWDYTDPDDLATMPVIAEIEGWIREGSCGSSYCIAGQEVHDKGYRMLYNHSGCADSCIRQVPTTEVDAKGNTIWEDDPEAVPEQINDVAARSLGLTNDEANRLFNSDNSVHTLKKLVNRFAKRRGLPVPYEV